MSIVCNICGGTEMRCTAVIDPNTRQFLEFTHNTLSDGQCSRCGNVAPTDPDEIKAGLDKFWTEYTVRHHATPNYTCCDTVRHGDYDGCKRAYIRIGGLSDMVEKYPVVAVCHNLEEPKSLALPDPTREFTLMGIQGFELHDVLENKTYEIEVDDLKIPVTTKEVLDFCPTGRRPRETGIGQYAAVYTAHIKTYREYTHRLDTILVRRLLDKERLMKVGESDGFRLKLHSDWFIILKRGSERMCAPFKYAVNTYCLDGIQVFDRHYVTLEDALLHCLNGFNGSTNIPDRYKSIGCYLSRKLWRRTMYRRVTRDHGCLPLDRNIVGTSSNVARG